MEQGKCKHYNGDFHNTHCELGIAYRDVTTEPNNINGIAFRKPCIKWEIVKKGSPLLKTQATEYARRGTCERYEDPTAEEVAASEREREEWMAKFRLTIPLIQKVKQEHKGRSWQGVETCPACNGKLHLSHAAINGHVWGNCETEGCLSWME